MVINQETILQYSNSLYAKMNGMQYSFADLQLLSNLENSTLCLVLIQLIRENKLEQYVSDGEVYYRKS